jgi:hypothetical protein
MNVDLATAHFSKFVFLGGSEPPPKPTESSGDDLEQWLDDILDD